MNQNVRNAYGFFDCATPNDFEKELPYICKLVETPCQFELSSTKDMNYQGDETLTTLAQEATQQGINCVLQTTSSDGTKTNTTPADEIASVLNQAYNSHLYKEKEPFNGEVVQIDSTGKYSFRD